MNFILASGSPRRREIMAALGIAFTVMPADIDETRRPGEDPFAYAARLSREKAAAVARRLGAADTTIAAADTIVVLAADTIGAAPGGILLGKPADAEDARRMLVALRGREHVVCTALTLLHQRGGAQHSHTQLTRTIVTMRDYSDDEIAAYIATGDPFDKAGSYAIQHLGFAPVAQIDGSYTNVVGLPVETLRVMLDSLSQTNNG